jgi:hypothetical protein
MPGPVYDGPGWWAGLGRVGSDSFFGSRGFVVLLAMLEPAMAISSATLSFRTPLTLPFLSNATSLCSLAVSFSLHALAPQVLPSHSNPNFMHISSFGSSIAASSPRNGVYKGTCCGSFCLSVCDFYVILMRGSCEETVLLTSGKVRLAKVLSGNYGHSRLFQAFYFLFPSSL